MTSTLRNTGLGVCVLICALGASCPRSRTPVMPPLGPVVFSDQTSPETAEIIRVVNQNSSRVQSLRADSAKLGLAGYPSLRADLSLERPRNFRLRAKILGAAMMNIGSNQEYFWFWARDSPTQAVLYARHDHFARTDAAKLLPVEPTWLPEALGLAYLDPDAQHGYPRRNPAGNIEISSRLQTASGPRIKVTEIHPRYGWVLRQDLAEPSGRMLVSARCSEHRYYELPQGGVALPHHVQLYMAPEGQPAMSLQLTISSYTINQRFGGQETYQVPKMDGYPPMDLTRVRLHADAFQQPSR